MKRFLLVIIAISLFLSTKATHQYGAELTWTCVGQDSFFVKYVYYRDCNGVNGSAGTLYVKCAATGSTINTYALNFSSTTDITNLCSGVDSRCTNSSSTFPFGLQRLEAMKLIDLSSAGSCCEILLENYGDSRVTTTNTSMGTGVYVNAFLNRCVTPCNNSPQFSNNPILLAEVNKDFKYNHGVYDIDMDSIAFEWTSPLNNLTNQLSFTGSFSYDKPISFWGFPNSSLPFPRGYHLDVVTGDISFRPTKVESSFIVLKVSEWRKINGTYTKIGEIRRDIALQIVSGAGNNAPAFTSSPQSYHVCAGDTFNLTITSDEMDARDTIRLQLNTKPPNSTWSDNNGQLRKASGNLVWATDTSDINSQSYVLNLSAFDDNCPVKGQYSKSLLIYVDPQPSAQLVIVKSNCNMYHLNSMHRKYVNQVKWYIGGQLYASTPTCYFNVTQPGTYPVCMELFGGTCSQKIYDTLFIPQLLDVALPDDTVLCRGESITIQSSISGSQGKVNYNWNTADTSTSVQIGPLYQDTLLILNVSDSLFCDIDSMWIKVDDFDIDLSQDTITCPGNPVKLSATPVFDEGKIVNSYKWLDLSCTCPQGQTPSIIVYMPGVFSCEAVNENGCKALDTITVVYGIEPKINFLQIPDICLNDEDVLLDSFVNPKGGIWYGQDTFIVKNNILRVDKAQAKPYLLFYSFTDTATHCFTIDKTTVNVIDYPKIKIFQPFSFCNVDEEFDLNDYVLPKMGYWHSNPALKFAYFFNPSNANPSNPLIYEIADSNGCSNERVIDFSINPLPQIDFEADQDTGTLPLIVQFTNKSSIASGSINNYLWYFGDGDSSLVEHPMHTYLTAGIYDVMLNAVSDSGCWSTLTKQQMINILSGISENIVGEKIKVYPNPASEFFVVSLSGTQDKLDKIVLWDAQGKKCLKFNNLKTNTIEINRGSLQAALYILQVSDSSGNIYFSSLLIE